MAGLCRVDEMRRRPGAGESCSDLAGDVAGLAHAGHNQLAADLVGVDVSKQQQTSDWGSETLTDAQKEYAASDVLYRHKLKAELEARLIREDRLDLAQRLFAFLPTRAELDLMGWEDTNDIFLH